MVAMHPDTRRRAPQMDGNMARQVLNEKARARQMIGQMPGVEMGVVQEYDFHRQRVRVSFKDSPASAPLEDVPIVGGSIEPLFQGSVGMLIPLRHDATMSFGDAESAQAVTPRLNRGDAWVFLPGEPRFDGQPAPDYMDPEAGNGDLDKVGPGDRNLPGPAGSRITFKADGTIVIVGKLVMVGRLTDGPGQYNDATRDAT